MNHFTLDLEAEIYIPDKPDKCLKKDMKRICSDSKLQETFFYAIKKWDCKNRKAGDQNKCVVRCLIMKEAPHSK